MSSDSSNNPTWFQMLLVVGAVWTANYVTLPKRNEEKILAALEATTKSLEIADKKRVSEPKAILLDTNVKQAGHDLKIALTPVVQLSPKITQSISCEDVREIRLRVLLKNLSESEADISRVNVKVESGAPIGNARDDLFLTQRFSYQRTSNVSNLVERVQKPSDALFDDLPRAPAEVTVQAPRVPAEANERAPRAPAEIDPAASLSSVPTVAQVNSVEHGGRQWPLSENDPLSKIPSHDCRHGRIFAVGLKSEHMKWTPIGPADQSFDTQVKLGPNQEAQHEFVFVVTEFPEQHNRQWFHFAVQVAYRGSEADAKNQLQHVDLFVSGLPLPCCSETAQPVQVGFKSCKNCGGDWEPDAPPLSTKKEAAPAPQLEVSPPRTLPRDDGGAKSIIKPEK
jgi:hypothetical protein